MRWLWFLAAASLALQAADTFTVTGTIVDNQQNRPLNYILVTLTSTQDKRLTASTITAADGRFGFTNLPAGKYSLSAQRRGNQQSQFYQQNDPFSTAIMVGAGITTPDIIFPLEAPGSISGTVLDQSGDPVRSAQIWLFRKAVAGGRSEIQQAGVQTANSSGAFHAGHLRPGTYMLAVSGRPWYAQAFPQTSGQPNPNPELDVAYPITYYGDTIDPASASPITVVEGGSVTVQINLRPVPAVHLDIGANTQLGQPLASGEVPPPRQSIPPNLMAETFGGQTIPVPANVIGVNGRGEMAGVAPGRYVVRTMTFDGDRGRAGSAARIDVTSNMAIDLQNLKLTSFSGQLVFEGAERPPNPVSVQLSCGNGRGFGARVVKDGTFTSVGDLVTGRCTVALGNAQHFYIKSVTLRGGKPSADSFDVLDGVQNYITVVAAGGATSEVEGIVMHDDKPFSSAMVLLVPEDPDRGSLIRRDQSDSDGSFTLSDIVPGKYTLLAIDDGKDLLYRDPAVIQPYLSGGTTLEFPRANKTPLKVNVLARRIN